MKRKIVPFLVSLMVISLLGIIIVQYRWIRNTLNEKQNLINNQVDLILSNVEKQLVDLKGAELVSNQIDFIEMEEFVDSVHRSRSYFFSSNKDSLATVNVGVLNKSHHTFTLGMINDIITIDSDHKLDTLEDNLQQIIRLIKKVDIEKSNLKNDIRLDSLSISKILKREFIALRQTDIENWGLYDSQLDQYRIRPLNTQTISYKKNLFSTDLLTPNRYQLQIGIDTSQLIWREIQLMVVLSILFLMIIVFVFSFSIRLLLKHKKISEIKSNFINNMTHEFKTPLSSISLAADSLIHPNTTKDESTIRKYVDMIQAERKKLNRHVERILEVGALKKDALIIDLNAVNLKEVIELAIQDLGLVIAKSDADIKIEPFNDIHVLADLGHLKSVFSNIIENAIKYSKSLPVISIKVVQESKTVMVRIKDNGIGMTANELKHIFKDFYRVQSGNIHQTKGFGLGLSYCKLVLSKMEGEIEVRSQLNLGTEVDVKLKQA